MQEGDSGCRSYLENLPATRSLGATTPTAVFSNSFKEAYQSYNPSGKLIGYTIGQIPHIRGVHGTEGVGATSDRLVAEGEDTSRLRREEGFSLGNM